MNLWGIGAGGNGGDFHVNAAAGSMGLVIHETGHSMGLSHSWYNNEYPYRGTMHGIKPSRLVHVGPTWGFDLPSGKFISPLVPEDSDDLPPGTWRSDGQSGMGRAKFNDGFMFGYWSDYHVNRIQSWLEGNIVHWNSAKKKYFHWNDKDKGYTKALTNTGGVLYPVKYDVSGYSILVGVSAATKSANIVYPPIGPYVTGIIKIFDPNNANDRSAAKQHYCPSKGCDVSLRIKQKNKAIIAMLPAEWKSDADQYNRDGYSMAALNIPANDGAITKIELLLTPNAETEGFPKSPKVLDTWTK